MNDLPNPVPTPINPPASLPASVPSAAPAIRAQPSVLSIGSYILNGVLVLALVLVLAAHRPMGPGFRPPGGGSPEDGARAFMNGFSMRQAMSMEHRHSFFGRFGDEDRPPMFRGEESRDPEADFDGGPGMFHPGGPRGMGEKRDDFRHDGMMEDRGERGPRHHEMGLEHHDPEQMAEARLNRLSEWLSLTDAEKAQIKPLLITQGQVMEKIHQDAHQAEEQARQENDAKIRALLTPDQQKLLPAAPNAATTPVK